MAPFFSKGIADPEICVTKQVPPFLHMHFSYNLGCCLLKYLSEQETRTSEFSKCGTNLMCNCTQVLVNCSSGFFSVNIHVYKAVWDFQMKGTTMSSYSLCYLLYNCRSVVAIKTSGFWRQDSQCTKLRFNFEVTIVQKPHTSNIWISKSFNLNYLSTVPHCKYDDAMVLTASVQKFSVALVTTTGFDFSFLPSSFIFFSVKRFS